MKTFSRSKLDSLIRNMTDAAGRRWTIREIAKAIDVSPSYLTLLRSGKRKHPSMNVVMKISQFFQVPVEELVEGETTARPTESFPGPDADIFAEICLLQASAALAMKPSSEGASVLEKLLEDFLSESTPLRIRAMAYQLRGRFHYQQEMYTQAISDYQQALRLASTTDAQELLFKIHYSLGLCYKEQHEHGSSLFHFEYAHKLYASTYPKIYAAHLLMGIGNTHLRLRNLDMALQSYHQAKRIYEEVNDHKFMADIHHNIARVDLYCGEYQQAIEQLHESLQAHRDTGDHLGVASDLLELAICHKELQQWPNMYECSLRAGITFEHANKRGLAARCKSLLVEAMLAMNRADKVPEMIDDTLKIFEELEWSFDLARSYRLKSEYYHLIGDRDQALVFSLHALKLFEGIPMLSP